MTEMIVAGIGNVPPLESKSHTMKTFRRAYNDQQREMMTNVSVTVCF